MSIFETKQKLRIFLRAINVRTLIDWNQAGISKKRTKQKLISVHSGYRDLTIGIKGIKYKSFQVNVFVYRCEYQDQTIKKRLKFYYLIAL